VTAVGLSGRASAASEVRRRRPRPSLTIGVAIVLLVAVGLRLWLLARAGWLLEGDDSLSTLMALGILDGDRPIMLKNQAYAAAWEPYAMALSFVAFGISRVSARVPELLSSLALIGTTALLAREVTGRIAAAWFAAILVATPPAYALVLWLKPWAPYTEVIVFGSLCVLGAVRLGWPCPGQRDWIWSLGCGAAVGLALWMHPLAISYLATGALTILARVRLPRLLTVVGWGMLGFVLGGVPIWLFNVETAGSTLRFILNGTAGQSADRGAVLTAWWNNDLPRGAGLWYPWAANPPGAGAAMAILVVGALIWAVARRSLALRRLDAVLLLLLLMPTVLVSSGFGGPALNPYDFDATGRYAPPIWSALAVVLGAALAAVWRVRRVLALGLAGIPLVLNLVGVLSIDPVAAFQSPYWDRLPVDNGPLLAVLRAEGVDHVWLNHWAGQPAMFDARAAGQPLIAYDWYDVQAGGIDRFPEYRALVEQAARPAFVLVTDEADPDLERALRSLGVTFIERRVPPYVVVIPASRRVHPSEVTAALGYRY
jgi:hypothetical protein